MSAWRGVATVAEVVVLILVHPRRRNDSICDNIEISVCGCVQPGEQTANELHTHTLCTNTCKRYNIVILGSTGGGFIEKCKIYQAACRTRDYYAKAFISTR